MLLYNVHCTERNMTSLRSVVCFVVVLLVAMEILISKSGNNYSEYLLRSLSGPLKYDDPELIRYIKEKVLELPSNEAYNVKRHPRMYTMNSEIFYRNFTKKVLFSKRNGFFVEAGALDGHIMSNTLFLEMRRGWTGILVEPDPSNYIALKKKHRKAWTARACLSVENYAKKEKLSSFDIRSSRHKFHDVNNRAMGSIVHEFKNSTILSHSLTNDETVNSYYVGQCFPLGSLLLALNVTRVDLLSLDIESAEEQVIRNFPFRRFDVQVIFLEWWNHERLPWLRQFMAENGYSVASSHKGDVIFVKRDSEMVKILDRDGLWGGLVVNTTATTTTTTTNKLEGIKKELIK